MSDAKARFMDALSRASAEVMAAAQVHWMLHHDWRLRGLRAPDFRGGLEGAPTIHCHACGVKLLDVNLGLTPPKDSP